MNSAGPWRTVQPRESLRSWLRRLGFNFFPAFRVTGARVIYLSEDMRKLRIKLPLGLRNRNIHGTVFGGAMYAVVQKTIYAAGKEVYKLRHEAPQR